MCTSDFKPVLGDRPSPLNLKLVEGLVSLNLAAVRGVSRELVPISYRGLFTFLEWGIIYIFVRGDIRKPSSEKQYIAQYFVRGDSRGEFLKN